VSGWGSANARRVLATLLHLGWGIKRQSGSHRTQSRPDWPDFVFSFHDDEEIATDAGPNREHTGLRPDDL
jgi:predicted RNA binding protein YcfA (HicA-like mRNA interferase family)